MNAGLIPIMRWKAKSTFDISESILDELRVVRSGYRTVKTMYGNF
jgi:hypothetical protein